MEFLKSLFPENNGALTFEQLEAAVKEQKMNVVNLAEGGYVSKNKHTDTINGLNGQISDLQGQISQRDTDLTTLRNELTAAQADAGKLGAVQQSLTDLQTKYINDKALYEQRLATQNYEFMVRERANTLQFSSTAAKKAFLQEAISKGFSVDGNNLLGYEDFVAKYKADDPGAFAVEKAPEATPPAAPPAIVLPSGGTPPKGPKTKLSELMRQKNEHPDMQITFD